MLFHDIAPEESPFTKGLGVTVAPDVFERRISYLASTYTFVTLDDVIEAASGRRTLPRRPILLTFDDAYGTVARNAAPVLEGYGVPALFFLNGAFIDTARLNLDNLVCFAVNTVGQDAVTEACSPFTSKDAEPPASVSEVLGQFVPSLPASAIGGFTAALFRVLDDDPVEEARQQELYLRRDQVQALASSGIEFGNHTYSHARCRSLDEEGCHEEIQHNADLLRELTGQPIRAFSVPYGSHRDLSHSVAAAVANADHTATFMVEGLPNPGRPDLASIHRVSMASDSDLGSLSEIEALPQLRRIKRMATSRFATRGQSQGEAFTEGIAKE